MTKPLEGQVALVAGATRGAGRGIARELALAGAKVYCTGRSSRARPGARPETIEETADIIAADGGSAVALRVDHTVEDEVGALAARIRAEDGRLDILVNDIWGGDPLIDWTAKFWTMDMANVRTLTDQAVLSHLITARHMAPLMIEKNRGLIVEVTDGEHAGYRGQLLYDLVKSAVIRLAYAFAWDLADTKVAAVAITPGFLRSEAVLESVGVSAENWREGARNDPDFAFSESPRYVGRAIAALASDPQVHGKSGLTLWVGDLAREYGFTDTDGSQPDFWRNMEAWLDGELASGAPLAKRTRWILGARYGHIHRTPAKAELARNYMERLDYSDLGAGLRPRED